MKSYTLLFHQVLLPYSEYPVHWLSHTDLSMYMTSYSPDSEPLVHLLHSTTGPARGPLIRYIIGILFIAGTVIIYSILLYCIFDLNSNLPCLCT